MSAPEQQREMTASIGLGLEPPLSPPVVGGPTLRPSMPAGALAGLPTPPPAIRPPETPRPVATVSAEEARALGTELKHAQPEATVASAASAEEGLPAMGPPEETPAVAAPVNDYFASDSTVELEPVQPSETQTPELALVAPPEAANGFGVQLVLRLQDGERVQIGEHESEAAAIEAAQAVIEQLATTAGMAWPFYAGRFIRAELIVSIDLVESGRTAA
jgi:hypothetical protein